MARHEQIALPLGDPIAEILEPLTAHDRLLRHFDDIHFDRVRYLTPLARAQRADALPRARRRVAELPSKSVLEAWYRTLETALTDPPDSRRTRELVRLMMSAMKGRPKGSLLVDTFDFALGEARVSSHIVAGAVTRTWAQRSMAPTLQGFQKIVEAHRAETRAALELVTRTMGLRGDAEKLATEHQP